MTGPLPIRRSNISTPKPVSASMRQEPVRTVPYNMSGPLSAAPTKSAPVTPANDMYITALSATLRTAGTSSSTVELEVNGSVVGTITLNAGDTYGRADFQSVHLSARTDSYAISLTAGGTGAADLGGEVEYLV